MSNLVVQNLGYVAPAGSNEPLPKKSPFSQFNSALSEVRFSQKCDPNAGSFPISGEQTKELGLFYKACGSLKETDLNFQNFLLERKVEPIGNSAQYYSAARLFSEIENERQLLFFNDEIMGSEELGVQFNEFLKERKMENANTYSLSFLPFANKFYKKIKREELAAIDREPFMVQFEKFIIDNELSPVFLKFIEKEKIFWKPDSSQSFRYALKFLKLFNKEDLFLQQQTDLLLAEKSKQFFQWPLTKEARVAAILFPELKEDLRKESAEKFDDGVFRKKFESASAELEQIASFPQVLGAEGNHLSLLEKGGSILSKILDDHQEPPRRVNRKAHLFSVFCFLSAGAASFVFLHGIYLLAASCFALSSIFLTLWHCRSKENSYRLYVKQTPIAQAFEAMGKEYRDVWERVKKNKYYICYQDPATLPPAYPIYLGNERNASV